MKTCCTCKIEKPKSNFSRNPSHKDLMQDQCKECVKIYNAEYRKKNGDKLKISKAEYHAANKEKISIKSAKYRADNSEKIKTAKSVYRSNNKEKIKEKDTAYRNANKEKLSESKRVYRIENKEKVAESKSNWYLSNRDRLIVYAKDYNEQNSERIKERSKQYYLDNIDEIREKKRIYSLENAEAASARACAWAKANPDKMREHGRNRRALENNVEGTLSKGLQNKLFELQCGCCAICKKSLPKNTRYQHMDHIFPLIPKTGNKAGTHTDDNMQLLCGTCNNRKYNKDPIDYMQSLGYLL